VGRKKPYTGIGAGDVEKLLLTSKLYITTIGFIWSVKTILVPVTHTIHRNTLTAPTLKLIVKTFWN